MASYKEEITAANAALAADPRTIFVGYGLQHGRAMGTIPATAEILETPVAENLMVGLAIGLSLRGRLPIVFIERFDFILNAADAIVNHLNAIRTLSQGEFQPAVILRAIVGNKKKPLFTGPVHTQEFTEAFRMMVRFPVTRVMSATAVPTIYEEARQRQLTGTSSLLIEYKDLL